MNKVKKYNIIIYSTLFLGILLLIVGGVYFLNNPEESYSSKNTTKELYTNEPEPEEMVAVDKAEIINNYLNELTNQSKVDDLINYDSIKTWENFHVGKIEFQRTIAFDYYEYKVDIVIDNPNATIPVEKNYSLSTEESQVITVLVDILKNEEIIVKNIDAYKGE